MSFESHLKALARALTDYRITNATDLEAYRRAFISKKGQLASLIELFSKLSAAEKKQWGSSLNALKTQARAGFKTHAARFSKGFARSSMDLDPTLPMDAHPLGSTHVLTHIQSRIEDLFMGIGFALADGPEIESEAYNFTALNFAEDHPARAMQDTFFLSKGHAKHKPDHEPDEMLLRTHTSSVQIRMMRTHKPPLRLLIPGRVYRNETITARAHCIFHQIEGLYIDQQVGWTDLHATLCHFIHEFFGKKTPFRVRASYFPFTAPSAEIDIRCMLCKGKGCNICKNSGWLEIAGCGMVHPNVLKYCKLNPRQYSGYAFGMGIERIAMLQTGIQDLRVFTKNDIQFLEQYTQIS